MNGDVRFIQWVGKKYEMTDLDFDRLPQETKTQIENEFTEEMNDAARERIKSANATRKNKETEIDWLYEHRVKRVNEKIKEKRLAKEKVNMQEKYYYVTKDKKQDNRLIFIIKIIAVIASIFVGGWLQELTLQPGVHNVYLGLSLVIWAGWSLFSYHALCRLMLCGAGVYKI